MSGLSTSLGAIHYTILENVSDEKHYAPLLALAAQLTASSVRQRPLEAHVALLLQALVPAFSLPIDTDDALATPLCLEAYHLLASILHTHSSLPFRGFFGFSHLKLSPSSSSIGATASALTLHGSGRKRALLSECEGSNIHKNAASSLGAGASASDKESFRCRDFWAEFAHTWTILLDTGSSTCVRSENQLCRNLLLMDILIDIMDKDLKLNIDHGRHHASMLRESLSNYNLSHLLRNHQYRILDTMIVLLTAETSANTRPCFTPVFCIKARELGVKMLNMIILLCKEAPSTNTQRMDYMTLDSELWTVLKLLPVQVRLAIYREMWPHPEFRAILLLTDLEEDRAAWTLQSGGVPVDPRSEVLDLRGVLDVLESLAAARDPAALACLLEMLCWDYSGCGLGDQAGREVRREAVEGVAERVGGGPVWTGLRVWAAVSR
ncbi:hypothetical protein BC830DRAFT_1097963 [Chytriomyces sp. MP71]|nr:hypothetical protein BC830DRAFT_1097963 [Chytriomyces sp. MP71]